MGPDQQQRHRRIFVKFKKVGCTIVLTTVLGLSLTTRGYEAFQGPTELIQYDPAKAFNGYTLFSPFRGKNTYLIDMRGNVVHMWPYPEGWGVPDSETVEKHARLLEDGNLLRGTVDKAGKGNRSGAIYQLINWDGEVIWQHDEERPGYSPHHDFRMIWNPKLKERTLLYVASRDMSHDDVIALGVDPELRDDYTSRPDGLVEVDMDGNVIWEWNVSDHVVQDINPDLPTYGVIAEHPGKMDLNFADGVNGDWIHINAIDYNEKLDQIVISNSAYSELQVIDHGATFVAGNPGKSIELAAGDDGDFVYRWGNPCAFDAGDCPAIRDEGQSSTNGHQQVFFIHDVQWIREKEVAFSKGDLPGAGNLMVFNNGTRNLGVTHSSVLEINPYEGDMEDGIYVPQMDAGYESTERGSGAGQNISKQIVWEFSSALPNSFFSDYISGAQRLPNGNTMINSGGHGHFFEVTSDGEVVWEYINPVGDRTGEEYGIYTIMTDKVGDHFNSVFRAARYAPDYAGLEGRDLTPMGKITEIHTTESARPGVKEE
jgi:hypothetical protein